MNTDSYLPFVLFLHYWLCRDLLDDMTQGTGIFGGNPPILLLQG